MPYSIKEKIGNVNTEARKNIYAKYHFSPRDMRTIDCLGDIIESRVTSLKVEVRMKSLEYVSAVTRYIESTLMNRYPVKSIMLLKKTQDSCTKI